VAGKYDSMTRADLESESERLAKERTSIREQQVEVNSRLDAFREIDRLNIDPERLQAIARIAKMEAKSASSVEEES
jgi:hypothetical protein